MQHSGESFGALRGAISRPPAAQQAVLLGVPLQHLSYDDVAEVTGGAKGTANFRLFRLRVAARQTTKITIDTLLTPESENPWAR